MINVAEIVLFFMVLLSATLFILDKKQHKDYEKQNKHSKNDKL